MKTVTISGKNVPAIGIGTWHMGDDPAKETQEIEAIRAGIDAGAKVVDTAEMYGSGNSEILVGKALAPYERDDIFLISKVLPSNASKAKMEQYLDASLERLNTDYLDLYLYHWRGGTPLSETINELERLKQTGKIRAWGVSNFDVADLEELWDLPVGKNAAANEDLYNIETRGIEYDLTAWQAKHDLPLIAYSPVGGLHNELKTTMLENKVVQEIATAHGVSAHALLLAWVIRDGKTIAIPQSSKAQHVTNNVKAADIELSEDELRRLDKEYPQPDHKVPLAIN
ncbi:aldo/keto reductase [Ligilactobacillus acidipiscis]|uniref:Aldo keto reductase family oxidoreductase n=1 Tax=Ligilactobacillus acidipiscis TaxID=89059 RepID=A0A0R2KIC2_9LACO|nr:aldo/keto reductase [Ligilactobacillus acidipiscis]KRN87285.1 aldo keto reductase family oxidoreductase [Ligilactobacillus acidipiscis]SFV39495.1 Oxidoreductase, aldo/keto reductase family [Ligilactobacillus acidipiscis]